MGARISLSFVLLLLAACGQDSSTSSQQGVSATEQPLAVPLSETERLNVWFNERNEEYLAFSPLTLTVLGRKEQYGSIDDVSEAGEQEELQWRAQTVEDLQANFDYAELTANAKVSYDVWLNQYEMAAAMAPYRRHVYIFEQMNGAHSGLPNLLINMHRVDGEQDMEDYISRISGIATAMDQLLVRAKVGAEKGVRPPRFAYEIVMEELAALVAGAPFVAASTADAPIWSDAKTKIEAILDSGEIDETKATELLAQVESAMLEDFGPAYQAVIDWLQEDYPNTDQLAQGVGALNNGADYYNALLADMTTTDLTADEIHTLGLNEVARIRLEMEELKDQVNFEGSLAEFFTFVKSDSQFLYPNDDEGRKGYLDDSTTFINVMEEKLPEYFGLLPKAGLEVRRVEAFREQDGAPQHYQSGTPDGSRDGVYYAHLSDMNAMPKYDMESVAYHEGIPGHHMQISIQQELEGVPEFRKQPSYTAYLEGWGLYSERLAKEMGGFEDPYKDFGRLNAEIWRAIRLVVDTGMHAKGWTQQEAVDYFTKNSSIAETAIRAEVRRYLVIPGQATSYKIGMLKILELRERALTELGDKFDIRDFHDTVLGGGDLPLSVLERVVDDWIASVNA